MALVERRHLFVVGAFQRAAVPVPQPSEDRHLEGMGHFAQDLGEGIGADEAKVSEREETFYVW